MPIYTKKGDKGQTSLFDGTKVSKANKRVETYGTVDELNSVLGEVIAFFPAGKFVHLKKDIIGIQRDLFTLGASLANPKNVSLDDIEKKVVFFEGRIDLLTSQMPELKNFIIPGGSKSGSLLHVARTLARRAERKLVRLMEDQIVDMHIVMYLNRLSDLLFTYARYVNFIEKKKEIKWIKQG